MNYQLYKSLAPIALGHKKPALALKNARVLNVFTEEITQCDVAVDSGYIVGVGSFDGREEIDLTGKWLVPGFIDAHLHFESTLVMPAELICQAAACGTTTFIADPHEAANVAGTAGIDFMLAQTEGVGANVFFMLPSCVPATQEEDNGCTLAAADMGQYMANPRILGLGEVMDYCAVTSARPDMMAKLALFDQRVKDGHAPLLPPEQLSAYAMAGIATDHECSDFDYALQQVRRGMFVHIRQGSGARNLDALVTGLIKSRVPTDRFCFCTDDKHIDDIHRQGHISYNIRRSIQLGLDPVKAYKMATINAARCYGLGRLGAIAPGFRADMVALDDFDQVAINSVFCGGTPLGSPSPRAAPSVPQALRRTVSMAPVCTADLAMPAGNGPSAVIQVAPGQLVTRRQYLQLPGQGGLFVPQNGLCKAVVAERHRATGRLGLAAVMGFGLTDCAIATSVSHDSHNIVAVGDSDDLLLAALAELERTQGGFTVVRRGHRPETLPLPIMGLISDAGFQAVDGRMAQLMHLCRQCGVPQGLDPFVCMSFLALAVIPEIRVTTRGIVHVTPQ